MICSKPLGEHTASVRKKSLSTYHDLPLGNSIFGDARKMHRHYHLPLQTKYDEIHFLVYILIHITQALDHSVCKIIQTCNQHVSNKRL
jgi:hypothetical protein